MCFEHFDVIGVLKKMKLEVFSCKKKKWKYGWFLNFLNYKKHEIIMFVDYENNVYTKHHKTFSKKCVLENDFFCAYQTLENVF